MDGLERDIEFGNSSLRTIRNNAPFERPQFFCLLSQIGFVGLCQSKIANGRRTCPTIEMILSGNSFR